MHAIRIDRSEPHFVHNRFCPELEPVLEGSPGEEVVMDTRNAFDGQISRATTAADLASLDVKLVSHSRREDLVLFREGQVDPEGRVHTPQTETFNSPAK